MKLARHFEVHCDFDLETPQNVGGSDSFAHDDFDKAISHFKEVVSEGRYNVRLIAVFIDDWDETDTILIDWHYPEDPEPSEGNAKGHRDWLSRQGEPPEEGR